MTNKGIFMRVQIMIFFSHFTPKCAPLQIETYKFASQSLFHTLDHVFKFVWWLGDHMSSNDHIDQITPRMAYMCLVILLIAKLDLEQHLKPKW